MYNTNPMNMNNISNMNNMNMGGGQMNKFGGGAGNKPAGQMHGGQQHQNGGGGAPPKDNTGLIKELKSELEQMTEEQFPKCHELLTRRLEELECGAEEPAWLELDSQQNIKVVKKIVIPTQKFPKFNFVGKLLGPGGKTLQALAKDNKCHVYILGKGSTRDKNKEEEQLNSGDPQFAHFGLPLHVKVETTATPSVSYERIGSVLAQLTLLLQPVRDDIVANQMSEMGKPFNPDHGANRGGMGGGMGGNMGQRGGVNNGMGRGGFSAPRGNNPRPPFNNRGGGNLGRIAPAGPVSYPGFASTVDGPGGKMRGGFSTQPGRNYNPY